MTMLLRQPPNQNPAWHCSRFIVFIACYMQMHFFFHYTLMQILFFTTRQQQPSNCSITSSLCCLIIFRTCRWSICAIVSHQSLSTNNWMARVRLSIKVFTFDRHLKCFSQRMRGFELFQMIRIFVKWIIQEILGKNHNGLDFDVWNQFPKRKPQQHGIHSRRIVCLANQFFRFCCWFPSSFHLSREWISCSWFPVGFLSFN